MASPSKLRNRRPYGASRTDTYDQDDEDHVDAVYQRPVCVLLSRTNADFSSSFTDRPERF